MLTALATLQIQWREEPPPVVQDLRQALGSWKGIGLLVDGLLAQDRDVELAHYPSGWRASVYHAGPTHSLVRGTGEARAATPWDALQRAAWEALSASERRRGADRRPCAEAHAVDPGACHGGPAARIRKRGSSPANRTIS
jgi:hypothetical protein